MIIDEVTEMYLKHESSQKPLALPFFIYRTSAHSSLHKAEYLAYTTSNSNNPALQQLSSKHFKNNLANDKKSKNKAKLKIFVTELPKPKITWPEKTKKCIKITTIGRKRHY